MDRKYELTDEIITINNHVLHRIVAIRNFSNVNYGDLGGFIESEANLSHSGRCWVYDNANVYEDARVYDHSMVYENAQVYGRAWICQDAYVYGNAHIYDDAYLFEYSSMYGDARVCGDVFIYEKAKVCGCAHAYGRARIFGKVELDSGIWNNTIKINNNMYLISTTLQKILMVEHVYE